MDAKNELVTTIRKLITEKTVNFNNAIELLKVTMQQVEKLKSLSGPEKRDLVVAILEEIAKGDDGISGTADDMIPEVVINGIKALIDNNLVSSTIDIIMDAAHGKLELHEVQGCLSSLSACIGSMKK